MCEKCEYKKSGTIQDGNLVLSDICVHCKELFPWREKSQFKEKKDVKR